jgi:hypothetical protein
MTIEEFIRLVFSFLGGGLIAGLLNWFRAYLSEKKERKISAIQSQIQNLYGPLQFFASQNESYFELNEKLHEAYQVEYVGKEYSQNEKTQKNLDQETEKTLDIATTYIRMVTKNNERILEVLGNNYAFIDPDDVDVFREFMVDYTRLKTEVDDSGRLDTPFRIYKHIGSISFMRPEFINRVREKFNAKKKELKSLTS